MKKEFDCVEMKRRGQDRIREETRGMSREEILAYWARAEAELRDRQSRAAGRPSDPHKRTA